jgi:hypothetical protein
MVNVYGLSNCVPASVPAFVPAFAGMTDGDRLS